MRAMLRNLVPLANLLGIYYQIRDDYSNLQNAEVSLLNFLLFTLRYKKSHQNKSMNK